MTFEEIALKSYWHDNSRAIYNKDCRSMAELPDECVQMVVTSPPYWGLRKYAGNQDLIWGGGKDCEHKFDQPTIAIQGNNSMVRGKDETDSGNFAIPKFKDTDMRQRKEVVGSICSLCGAWRGQLGLEPTPELYIQHLIEILREIKRVLRADGVVFWNIGDTYWGGKGSSARHDHNLEQRRTEGRPFQKREYTYDAEVPQNGKHPSLKPKDLCLIPERFALSAQNDGWWVRSRICWDKPNPMPESVRDRPTDSWEHIWMLTKSAKYFWDAEAVREPQTEGSWQRFGKNPVISPKKKWAGMEVESNTAIQEHIEDRDGAMLGILPNGRNLRSVWTFPTQPYPGAHFATFPEELPRRCIKAATSEVGCCAKCGKPWERMLKESPPISTEGRRHEPNTAEAYGGRDQAIHVLDGMKSPPKTLGWRASCKCNTIKPPVPCLVLDPFAGSGTVLKVAAELGRRAVGYEISEEYCKLVVDRNRQAVLS